MHVVELTCAISNQVEVWVSDYEMTFWISINAGKFWYRSNKINI